MAHIKIEPIPGIEHPGPNDIRILIDGVEVKDLAGYAIQHEAASKMPIVVIRIATTDALDIELPEADVRQAGAAIEQEPEEPPRTRVVLGHALSVLSQADADLRQGVDISDLAVRYCSLGMRQRFTVMQVLGLLSAAEYSEGMSDPKRAQELDRDAITRAIAQGKLKEFDAAILDACETYRVCPHGGDFNSCEMCLTEWASAEMAARARIGYDDSRPPGYGLGVLLPKVSA